MTKPHRAGYGPHCRVLRSGHRQSPVFIAEWKGRQAPHTFLTEGAARAYLATCDVAGRLRA